MESMKRDHRLSLVKYVCYDIINLAEKSIQKNYVRLNKKNLNKVKKYLMYRYSYIPACT